MSGKTQILTRTSVLLAIALTVQFMHLPSFFTGPFINAVLILASIFAGITGGILIGCITPVVALLMAIIPPVLAPMVPIIMLSNTVLVVVFKLLSKTNQFLALFGAALFKYGIFYLTTNYLLEILHIKLPAPVLAAFQLPQLYTAIIGGTAALVIAKSVKKVIGQ